MAVNFVGRIAAMNFPATGVLATVAECAAVDLVEAENFAAIAVVKWSVVDCVVDKFVEVVNFVIDGVMDAADRLVGAANYVGGAAVETDVDRVVRTVNCAANVAATNVDGCAVLTVNVAPVLAFDDAAIAIVFENVDVVVDTVNTASTVSCSAIQVAFPGG